MYPTRRMTALAILMVFGLQSLFMPTVLFAAQKPKNQGAAGSSAPKLLERPVSNQLKKPMQSQAWDSVDWGSSITLPSDVSEYQNQLNELLKLKDYNAIARLTKKTHSMKSKETLDYFNVPMEVRELVERENDTELLRMKLQEYVLKKNGGKIMQKNTDVGHIEIVKANDVSRQTPGKIIPYKPKKAKLTVAPVISNSQQPVAPAFTPFDVSTVKPVKLNNVPLSEKSFFHRLKLLFVDEAHAQAANPLIVRYDGIRENVLDNALYYIAQSQNDDGSFGQSDMYAATADVIDALARFRRTNNDAYVDGLNYLNSHQPENNQERAIKIRLLNAQAQNYDQLLADLLSTKNSDGGYGYDVDFMSDVLSTLEVIDTLTAIQYNGDNSVAEALAFVAGKIDAQGGLYYSENAAPSYFLINRALMSLYPYRDLFVGDENNRISISQKVGVMQQLLVDNFSLDEGHLLGTEESVDDIMTARSLNLYAVQPEIVSALKKYVKLQQSANGGFNDSVFATIQSMRLLAVADLQIVSVTPVGNLISGQQMLFDITFRNKGYTTTTGTDLHGFVDGFSLLENPDLENCPVTFYPNQEATTRLTLPPNLTSGFLNTTNLKFFVEPDADLNYDNNWKSVDVNVAPPAGNVPAMPVYYSAQGFEIDNAPGIVMRWSPKADANRSNYVVMLRQKGTADWQYLYRPNNSESVLVGLATPEGTIFEVTFGVVHNDGTTVTYFNDITEIRLSNNPDIYSGTVNAFVTLDNEKAPAMAVTGTGGVSGKTDSSGNVQHLLVPNGKGVVRLDSDFYESLWTRYPVVRNAVTNGVRIFTHLKEDAQVPVITDFRMGWNFTVNNQSDRFIQFTGSDNIGIMEGDIYYWDPAASRWNYILTRGTEGQNGAGIWWTVPAELLGAGYKLKLVVRDYRGNESLPREWGPFTVIDGTPPQFTITSPNGGENLALGTNQTITWTTESAHPVNRVNLYLDYPGGSDGIASNVNNTGSYQWNVPFNSRYAGTQAKVRILGSDSVNFIESTDVSDDIFTISDNSTRADAPWLNPEMISHASLQNPPYGNIEFITSQYDAAGTLHVVFSYIHDQFIPNRVVTSQLLYIKKQNGVWSNPSKIYERVFNTDANLNGYERIQELKMDVDGRGNPYILWNQSPLGDCTMNNHFELYSMQFDGAAWSQPLNITQNNTYTNRADFDVDANGNMRVVWLDGLTFAPNCTVSGNEAMYIKTRTAAGVWQPAQVVVARAGLSNPQIIYTANGTSHIVYVDGNVPTLKHITSIGNGWSNAITVVEGNKYLPQIVEGTQNTLHSTYYEFYQDPVTGQGRMRVMYTAYDGVQWSQPVEVSPIQQGYSAERPKISVDVNGDPHVMFTLVGGNASRYMWTERIGNVWSTAKPVSLPTQYVDGSTTSFVYDSVHDAAALWVSSYSYFPEIFVSTGDMSSDYIAPDPVANIRVTALSGPISISWNQYANLAADFDHFNIYRATLHANSVDGLAPIQSINTVNTVQFVDNSVVAGQGYYYAVTVVDAAGNENKNVALVGPTLALPSSLVSDGTMESLDLAAWPTWGAPNTKEKSRAQSFTGAQSLHLNTQVSVGGGTSQRNIPVQAGRTYRLSFAYKLMSGKLTSSLGIRSSNVDFEKMAGVLSQTGQQWQIYSRIFTVPQDFMNDFRLTFAVGNGDVYIDDVMIVEVPATYLFDGDMELQDAAAWVNWGNPGVKEKSAVEFVSGTRSLHVDTRVSLGGGVQQINIPVRPNRTYKLSFKYKLLSGELFSLLGIRTSNSDFENKKARFVQAGNVWKSYSRTFTVPSSFVNDLRLVYTLRAGEVFIDDVLLEETPVADGNMEALGLESWSSWGSPSIREKSNAEFVSGTQSLHLNTIASTGGGAQQVNVKVKAGHAYRLSLKYKLLSGQFFALLGIRNSNTDFENRKARFATISNDWQSYTREFTVPQDFAGDFRIVFPTRSTNVYIDDVDVQEIQ